MVSGLLTNEELDRLEAHCRENINDAYYADGYAKELRLIQVLRAERTRWEAAEKLLRRVQGEGLRSDIMRGIDLLLDGRTLEGGEGIE